MKRMLVALVVVGLSGCATYSEMQQKTPYSTNQTAKGPQAFADCALPRLVDVQADAHVMKDGDASVLVLPIGNRGGDLAGTITATPSGQGSEVAIRATSSRSADKMLSTIKACL